MSEEMVTTRPHWLIFWLMRGVSALAFFMAGTLLVLSMLQPVKGLWVASIFFVFVGVAPFLVTNTYIEINEQFILLTTFYGKFKINWDEVKYLEKNRRIYAFTGENKRVAIIVAPKLINFIMQQVQKRNIEVRESYMVPDTQKNSRI